MADDLRTFAIDVAGEIVRQFNSEEGRYEGRIYDRHVAKSIIAAIFSDPTFRERAIEVMAKPLMRYGLYKQRAFEAVYDALARELAGGGE